MTEADETVLRCAALITGCLTISFMTPLSRISKAALRVLEAEALGEDKERTDPPQEEPKVADAPSFEISVRTEASSVGFKVRSSTRLATVFKAWMSQSHGLDGRAPTFRFDGDVLSPTLTVGDVGLEQGDVIEVTV